MLTVLHFQKLAYGLILEAAKARGVVLLKERKLPGTAKILEPTVPAVELHMELTVLIRLLAAGCPRVDPEPIRGALPLCVECASLRAISRQPHAFDGREWQRHRFLEPCNLCQSEAHLGWGPGGRW